MIQYLDLFLSNKKFNKNAEFKETLFYRNLLENLYQKIKV